MAAKGENTHHVIEAIFKAFARSLRMAVRQEAGGRIPSTKGEWINFRFGDFRF